MLQTRYTITHSKYTGSTSSTGYPTGDQWDSPVSRKVFGWYPLSSLLNPGMDYDRRVITSKVVMVPDASVYSPRDKVVFPGGDPAKDAYFVSQDVRDYTTGPFSYKPGGEIIVEKVTG